MNWLSLAVAIFLMLVGFLFTCRFILFCLNKATFGSLWTAYWYAVLGSAGLAAAAWFGARFVGLS